jgi:hypothetical protein
MFRSWIHELPTVSVRIDNGFETTASDEEHSTPSGVLPFDDRSAVGAGAAPPQKQRGAVPNRGPTSYLEFVQGESPARAAERPAGVRKQEQWVHASQRCQR